MAKRYPGKDAYCGNVAINYDRDRVGEAIWAEEQRWVEQWAKNVPPGSSVLDLPAGTGRFVPIWMDRGMQATAADASEDMLNQIRQKFPAAINRICLDVADVEVLRYKQQAFDYVVCWRLFHLLPNEVAEGALRELARVSRKEIVLEVFNVSDLPSWRLAVRRLRALLRKRLQMHRPVVEQTPWSAITSYPKSESEMQRLFRRCRVKLMEFEDLNPYEGTVTRIYRLNPRA